jgi:hypothetical protein
VRIVVAATLWGLFSCFLIFPLAGLPALMHRLAMTLIVAELLALAFWYYGSQGCQQRPCGSLSEFGYTVATIDVPLLGLTLVAFAAVRGVLIARRAARRRAAGVSRDRPPAQPAPAAARAEPGQPHTRRSRRASPPPAAPR